MKRITKWHRNKVVGIPSEGCKFCALGSKLVLFITGICDSNCFYCPISKERRNDVIFANEQRISTVQEAIEEAKMISALGMGITGGEPALKFDRTISFLTTLKKEFGKAFHVHLYTSHSLSTIQLKKLYLAGLDEIRFHPPRLVLSDEIKESIKTAQNLDWKVGIEIPLIPDYGEKIEKIVNFSIENNLDFINMNEFEITEANIKKMDKMNYHKRNNISAAVDGSEILAHELLKKYKNSPITIHYCSSSFKDRIQLRNRLLRRAKNYSKSFDEITDEGLIVRARIIVKEKTILSNIANSLVESFNVDEDLIELDKENFILYTHWKIAKRVGIDLTKKFSDKIETIQIIHQYPYLKGIITYLEPIYDDPRNQS